MPNCAGPTSTWRRTGCRTWATFLEPTLPRREVSVRGFCYRRRMRSDRPVLPDINEDDRARSVDGPLEPRHRAGVRGKASCRPRFLALHVWVRGKPPAGASGGVSVLDHGKRRGAYRASGEADQIDLGHEPPLSVDGESNNLIDRRRVSVQWFSGTILTGLCGAALMGGAVFASLDGQSNFATVPERVQLALQEFRRPHRDRTQGRPPAAAERIQHSTPGDPRHPDQPRRQSRGRSRSRFRARRRQSCALGLRTVRQHPPLQSAANAAGRRPGGRRGAQRRRPRRRNRRRSFLRDGRPRPACCRARRSRRCCRSTMCWSACAMRPTGPAACRRGRRRPISRAIREWLMPRREIRIPMPASKPASRPKTSRCCRRRLRKPPAELPGTSAPSTLRRGESVASVLRDLGARPDDIKAITAVLGARGRDGGVRENHKLRILLAPTSDPRLMQPIRVVIANDTSIEAVVAWSDLGRYVSVDIRNMETEIARARSNAAAAGGRGGRRQGRAALPEHLRDRAAQPGAAPADRGTHPHLFVRRRFPAPRAARRFVRGPVCRRGEMATTARAKCCSPR